MRRCVRLAESRHFAEHFQEISNVMFVEGIVDARRSMHTTENGGRAII